MASTFLQQFFAAEREPPVERAKASGWRVGGGQLFLWMNCHAKRLESPACWRCRKAVVVESGSKLHALQTLRAVRVGPCPHNW